MSIDIIRTYTSAGTLDVVHWENVTNKVDRIMVHLMTLTISSSLLLILLCFLA